MLCISIVNSFIVDVKLPAHVSANCKNHNSHHDTVTEFIVFAFPVNMLHCAPSYLIICETRQTERVLT